MRQRGRQSETRGLTLGSVLSAGQTRSQARSAADSRTRLRSASSVQRNKGDVRFSMALPFTSEPLEGKIDMALGPRCDSNHRASKKSLSSVRLHRGLVLSPMVAAPTPPGTQHHSIKPAFPRMKNQTMALACLTIRGRTTSHVARFLRKRPGPQCEFPDGHQKRP
jgi:hypothetical protein